MLLMALVLMIGLTGCQQLDREMKDMQSSVTGLDRTVEVYDYTGNLMKTYKGKIDIQDKNSDGKQTVGKVKFELNGKRVIIYNAVVIVEEN
jgi:hypothetical protein